MPRFILINETTRHACFLTRDETRQLIDIRTNPGGYMDVDQCMAMIDSPADKTYRAFPLMGRMGEPLTIHVEGRMDYRQNLKWKQAGHRCDPRCLLEPMVDGPAGAVKKRSRRVTAAV